MRAYSQFPQPDLHRLDTRPYGLRTKSTKDTKEPKNEALDPVLELEGCSSRSRLLHTPRGHCQPVHAMAAVLWAQAFVLNWLRML